MPVRPLFTHPSCIEAHVLDSIVFDAIFGICRSEAQIMRRRGTTSALMGGMRCLACTPSDTKTLKVRIPTERA